MKTFPASPSTRPAAFGCLIKLLGPALVLAFAPIASADATTFSARGNEPSWHVEIGERGLVFGTLDGGSVTISPVPEVENQDGSRVYEAMAQGRPFSLTIRDEVCVDTMSGMPHPNTAAVRWGDVTYSGCGGEPRELLDGEWQVESVEGRTVLAGSQPVLTFGSDGRVAGNASCNRFTGSYRLTGETLTFSALALTRMACEQALMTQEQAFVRALESISGFGVGPRDSLVLLDGDTPAILAKRK